VADDERKDPVEDHAAAPGGEGAGADPPREDLADAADDDGPSEAQGEGGDDGEDPDPDPDQAAAADDRDATAPPGGDPKTARKRRGFSFSWWWLLPAAMVVEFYVYGRNGYIDVCVGKEGATDFSLIGQRRTDENRWKFPRCEQRTNLGLRSTYGDKLADGVKVACRQATLFRNQGEAAACEAAENGWQHEVRTSFCPPWDPNYYEHLFWFLK
jgi:hypothetical protein